MSTAFLSQGPLEFLFVALMVCISNCFGGPVVVVVVVEESKDIIVFKCAICLKYFGSHALRFYVKKCKFRCARKYYAS